MANLRDVRGRIRGVSQTLQVTKAMKLISTAKLRKARRLLADAEPYFDRILSTMVDVAGDAGRMDSGFLNQRTEKEDKRAAVIVVTSDKGMAGGFSANAVRKAEELCRTLENPFLITVGAMGVRLLSQSSFVTIESFVFRSKLPELKDAKEIADFVVSQFLWEAFDEIHIVYTHMYGPVRLIPRSLRLLPLDPQLFGAEKASETEVSAEADAVPARKRIGFEFLPSATAVFDELAPLYVKGVVYGALVESYASEQSARMAAMDEASKNADEMLGALRLAYNRARQAAITQEVTEIVSGASALAE